MSDTQFTPGPWFVDLTAYTGGVISTQTISHGMNAYQDGPQGDICAVKGGNPADSHLIAAAPDLYEALDKVARRIEAGDLDEWSLKALTGVCRDAQSKARGEQS